MLLMSYYVLLLVGQALFSLLLQSWSLLDLQLHQSLELLQVFLQMVQLLGQLLLDMLFQLQGDGQLYVVIPQADKSHPAGWASCFLNTEFIKIWLML
jgi:hypothetical protein